MHCTSKDFDALSYNPFLLSLRKANTNDFTGFLMQKLNSDLKLTHSYAPARGTPSLQLSNLPADSKILCSFENGLVVFECFRPHTEEIFLHHVSKPASGQIVAIPNPNLGFPTLNVSIVTLTTAPFRYKILRMSACRDMKTRGKDVLSPVRLELFDSRSWEWKEFEWVMLDYGVYCLTKQPIVVSGSVYVLFSDMTILCFNMYTESFSSVSPPLPIGVKPGYFPKSSQLVKINQSLGFARRSANNIWTIWVLKGGIRWTALYNLLEQPYAYPHALEFDDPTAFLQISFNVYLFFKGASTVDNVVASPCNLFVFKSNSEPVNLNGRE